MVDPATVKKVKSKVTELTERGVVEEPKKPVRPEKEKRLLKCGTAYIKKSYYEGKILAGEEEEELDLIPVKTYPEEVKVGSVGVQVSQTIQTAPYESFRIQVSVNVPSVAEEVEDAYEAAGNFALEKCLSGIADVKEYLKEG